MLRLRWLQPGGQMSPLAGDWPCSWSATGCHGAGCASDLYLLLIANSGSEGSAGSSVKLVWVRCRVLLPNASDTNILHASSPAQAFPVACAPSCLIPKALSPWQHARPHNPCGALIVCCLCCKWQLSKTEKAALMRNAGFSAQHGWDWKCFQFQLENRSL